jgi:hypothetical protein
MDQPSAFRALEIGATKERQNGARNTSHARVRHGIMVRKTRPPMGMSYFQKEGQNEYWRNLSAAPKRNNFNNLYKWLVPR